MSSLIGKFLTILGLKRREANVLVVGLDNSGKSTILNYLKRKEDQVEEVVPTVGFTVERLSGLAARNKSGIALTAFDMSGQGRYRNLWEHYYANVEGIIFVVDSTDALRLVVARDELEMMLKLQLQASGAVADDATANGDSVDESVEDEDGANDHELSPEPVGDDDDDEGSGSVGGSAPPPPPPPTTHSTRSRLSTNKSRAAAFATRGHHHSRQQHTDRPASTAAEPPNSATNSRMKSSSSTSSLASNHSISSLPNTNFRRPDIPILFFANKMDLKDALPSVKISQMLGLQSFPHRNWHIQASNAITGEGVQDGIEWIIYQIARNKKSMPNSMSSGSMATAANSIK